MVKARLSRLGVVCVGVAVLLMIAGTAVAPGAALASQKQRTIPYTLTGNCAQVSQTSSPIEIVCAGHSSIDGDGAAVATYTFNGTHATGTSIAYFADGVRRTEETFTVATDATGMITLTGSGTCIGGRGAYKHAKCSYALTGATNPKTSVGTSKEVGTVSR
jgi:hypothetical protein